MGCASGSPGATAAPDDAGAEANVLATDAGVSTTGTRGDGGLGDGAADETNATDANDTNATDAAAMPVTQSFIRIANWTPDAPSAGFDVCLAPMGTTNWIGPLLGQTFPASSLGQGGPNGIQFPWVTKYFGVAPAQYDIQVVPAGATDCSTGLLDTTHLPNLALGAHTTFATVGDVNPRGNDTEIKIAVFFDDLSAPSGRAALRVVSASPLAAYFDVGTGSIMAHDFVPLFTSVGFGTAGMTLADGGTLALTGYLAIDPVSGVQFSAHPTGTTTADTVTATHVSLAAGSVTTMALVNGAYNDFPTQIVVCTDNGVVSDEQTPCAVFAQ